MTESSAYDYRERLHRLGHVTARVDAATFSLEVHDPLGPAGRNAAGEIVAWRVYESTVELEGSYPEVAA